MLYETLELRVTRQAAGVWQVHAEWARGRGSDTVRLDPALTRDIEALSAGGATDRAFLREVGRRLFECLFDSGDGLASEQLNQCWGAAKFAPGRGMRIRLRLEPPEAAALPWEFLFWPTEGRFMATSVRTGLVRFLDVPDTFPDPRVELPVRVLIVSPAVADLDTATEVANLVSVLESLEDVAYEVLDGVVTRDDVRDALREAPCHVLHFIGHSGLDDLGPYLILNRSSDSDVSSDPAAYDELNHEQFVGLLENCESLMLVTLNSCRGAVTMPGGPLVGMAQQLVDGGVPAVVAMQFPIYDKVALDFSREFYRSLFTGANRGDVEMAVSAARKALETDFPDTPALGTPVLFLNRESGVLFDLVKGRFWKDVPRRPEEAQVTRQALEAQQRRVKHLEGEGGGTAEELAEAREALRSTRQRLRTGVALAFVPLSVAVLVFLGSWVYVLQRFSRWARLETLTVRLAEIGGPEGVDPDLVLVTVDSSDIAREEEPWGQSWRPRMALLMDRLVEGGARVVALDVTFDSSSVHDGPLAAALAAAREQGTDVVVGVKDLDGDRPLVASDLEPVDWGAVCGASGSSVTLDLMIRKAMPIEPSRDLPSLPLRAVAAFRDARVSGLSPDQREILMVGAGDRIHRIPFASLDRIDADSTGCPLLSRGDTVAKLVLDYSRRGALRDATRTFSFSEIVRSNGPPPGIEGKLVLVGVPLADLSLAPYPGLGGGRRYGYEFMADGVSTLLAGVAIRPLSGWGSFLLLLAAAFIGAALAVYPQRLGIGARVALFSLSALALLGIAVWAYRAAQVMILVAYPAVALVLAFAGMVRFRRWRTA